MTVGQLIEKLKTLNPDEPVIGTIFTTDDVKKALDSYNKKHTSKLTLYLTPRQQVSILLKFESLNEQNIKALSEGLLDEYIEPNLELLEQCLEDYIFG